ncbi:MAG: tetratricopeptide repeat protein [Pegethrix bostrychoides GSE-TBD4-15B]|jgi:tetratricopeptide (TPR) repeat protein|uniref:Tetratricopeptide repeat protein n=1 Tax=Pegethrix bostrychoides GSE-TBD4-15B TaxID=2839662 RepID=A0A951U6M6_9CYAN|nr:tetratricopeptide repeat protein [Pegethrix bostrychoides GSE-TBD4-15B]
MKKHSWLNALENMSLVGLGAGSVASLLLNQLLFTTAPLSLLVVLGLMSRRKLAQVSERRDTTLSETDQYLALQVDRLHHQIASLPTPETINRLNRTLLLKNQEVSEKLHSEIGSLRQGVHQRLASVEQQSSTVRKELRQAMERSAYVMENMQQLTTDFGDLSSQVQAETLKATVEQMKQDIRSLQANLDGLGQAKPNLAVLQEHITRLDRQFSKLPPPVDVSSLKREVGELIKIVADLVPRRDLISLTNEIQTLQERQENLRQSVVAIETAALNFRRSFNSLPKAEALAQLGQTSGKLDALEAALSEQLAEQSQLAASGGSQLYPELQEIAASYLGNLRQQLSAIQDFAGELAQQQQQLKDQLSQLPQTLDVVALQRQFSELSQRIPASETELNAFRIRIQDVMQQELNYISQQMQAVTHLPQSELIFDLPASASSANSETAAAAGSRAVLEQALAVTEQRLILIWPWSNQQGLDAELCRKFEDFLDQGKRLEIGWCYLAERNEERWLSKMQRGWSSDQSQRSLLQETLHQFLQLKRIYPDRFQFKILGTAENFLVADQSFAVLGIAEALKTTSPFPELQLKLRTTDAAVIGQLVQRFDNPTLADEDLTAHWNRAVTRYILGDKTGAIADFSHLLSMSPEDYGALNYRGLAYYDQGDYDRAFADFSASIQCCPQQSMAYCNRGFIQAERGEIWEAIEDYSCAIQVSPQAPTYFYRGVAYQQLENYAEAIADYSSALRLAPDSPVAHYHRALAARQLGYLDEAISDFEQAAQLFWLRGNKTNAQKALKNLAQLRRADTPNAQPEAVSAIHANAMPEAV